MAANTTINISNLDFDALQKSFISYLTSQSTFKDFAFAGSVWNIVIDFMSQNDFLNGFYMNMLANEVWLDSALLRDSAVSRAKELNYLPGSKRSSQALVNLIITADDAPPYVFVPVGTTFSGSSNNVSYNFVTIDSYVATRINGQYIANNVAIYEGDNLTYAFSGLDDPFVIPNSNVDITSIGVTVQTSQSDTSNTIYSFAENLLGVTDNSAVYFLEPASNGQYEVQFGDGVFGIPIANTNIIYISYRLCNGTIPDGIDSFELSGNISGYTAVSVDTVTPAYGGGEQESIDSIKYRAPRSYRSQYRTVTIPDYQLVLMDQFSNYIKAMRIYGGEKAVPPLYGRVIISIEPNEGTILTNTIKNEILDVISKSAVVPITPLFVDPTYLNIGITGTIYIDQDLTQMSLTQILNKVGSALVAFDAAQQTTFSSKLKFSQLLAAIQRADASISYSDISLSLIKKD